MQGKLGSIMIISILQLRKFYDLCKILPVFPPSLHTAQIQVLGKIRPDQREELITVISIKLSC